MERDRLAPLSGCGLQVSQLLTEPPAKVGGQIVAEGERVPLPILLVGRVELEVRTAFGEVELPDSQGGELVVPQPGENQRLVDQGSLPTDRRQPGRGFGPQGRYRLPLPLHPPDGPSIGQRPGGGDGE